MVAEDIDLFKKDRKTQLVVVDYYSKYISLPELKNSTNLGASTQEFEHLYCMLEKPNMIVSDNGSQVLTDYFNRFADK